MKPLIETEIEEIIKGLKNEGISKNATIIELKEAVSYVKEKLHDHYFIKQNGAKVDKDELEKDIEKWENVLVALIGRIELRILSLLK